MDYNTASEILQGIMEDNYLEEEQVEAMETAGAIAIAHTMDELFDYINK